MKLALIMVLTPDLEEARRFYSDALGFVLKGEAANQLVFDADGLELHVFRCSDPAPNNPHASAAATVAVFEVASIEMAMQDMKSRGVEFLHASPVMNTLGGFRYAAFRAPGGNVHEIVERL